MSSTNPFDIVVAFIAAYFYLVVVALGVLYLLIWHRSQWTRLAVAAAFMGGLGYILAKITTHLIASPRPFIVTGHPALIASSTDNGFPSDHALLLVVVAVLVTIVSRRVGLAFWIMALLVGLARVYAGVHHLIDIAGSFIIVGVASLVYLLALHTWNAWREGRGSASSSSENLAA